MLFTWLGSLFSSSKSSSTPTVPSNIWTTQYSTGVPRTFTDTFFFPPSDGVHYVVRRAPEVREGNVISLTFSLEGTGTLVPTKELTSIPRIRLYLQQKGDTLTASEPYKRWWSTNNIELLSPGVYTLRTQVTSSQWSSVFGKNGSEVPSEYLKCISNLGHIGFTFGGSFAGHGVYASSGQVTFKVIEFSIL